jgi:phospholipase/carboxylesterase
VAAQIGASTLTPTLSQGRGRTAELKLETLPHIELATGAEPAGTVIWLHGLGADGWDFVPIVRELPLPESLALRFIFPHAPTRPVTINNGVVMRAWYDIAMNDIARLPDERGIRASQAQVEQLIARERRRGVDDSRIVLAGFSQGGAIALQAGLRHKERLGGIVALSTYLTLQESLAAESSPANRALPIFMGHGTEDPIVPLALAEASAAALRTHGYSVEWHAWPMPHSVCAEEVQLLASFLVGIYGTGRTESARSAILLP